MSLCKLSLCLLLIAIVQFSSSSARESVITISKSNNMSADMKLEAVNELRRVLNSNSDVDPCEPLANYFQESYPDYNWNVVDFNGYLVRVPKSLSLSVNNEKYYLLFATNK